MLRINKLKLGNPKLMHGQDQIQQPFFIFKKQNYESCFTLSKFLQKSGHVKTVFHTQLWVNQSYIFSVTWQIRVCSARKCVMDCKSFWQKNTTWLFRCIMTDWWKNAIGEMIIRYEHSFIMINNVLLKDKGVTITIFVQEFLK